MRRMFQDRARTCDFFDAHDFFLFAVACDFLARLIRVFRLTFSGTVSGDVSPNSRMLLCHPVGWYKADS